MINKYFGVGVLGKTGEVVFLEKEEDFYGFILHAMSIEDDDMVYSIRNYIKAVGLEVAIEQMKEYELSMEKARIHCVEVENEFNNMKEEDLQEKIK